MNLMGKYKFHLFFLLYFCIRIGILYNYPIDYVPVSDAANYLTKSAYAFSDPRLYYEAPLFFLLFLKLLGQHVTLILVVQCCISIVAWWLLASFIYQKLKPTQNIVAWVFSGLLLVFSCSLKITEWDHQVLTESLTISLFVLFLYFYFQSSACYFKSKFNAFAMMLTLLAFVLVRAANAYYLLFCTPLFLFLLVKTKELIMRRYLAGMIVLIISCFTLVNIAASKFPALAEAGGDEVRADGSAIGTPVVKPTAPGWHGAIGGLMSMHLAYYPSVMDYFSAHGMPAAARKKLDVWVKDPQNQRVFYGQKLFVDPTTQGWFKENSRETYLGYLITHPSYFFSPFASAPQLPNNRKTSLKAVFHTPRFYANYYGPAKNNYLFELQYQLNKKISTFKWSVFGLFILLVGWSIYSRQLSKSISLQAAIYYFLVSVPYFLFVWHADAGEPDRHQMLTYVGIILSLLLGFVFIVRSEFVTSTRNLERTTE